MVAGALGYMARAADGGRAAELVTRDFLGGCVAADDTRDAAAAATARHDSVSGKLSLQKQTCPATPRDLNLFPFPGADASAAKPCPSSTAEAAASGAGGTTTTTTYHSVCTIEKVKTALERFERGKHHQHQQQHSTGASPSSSSVTTSSVKRRGGGGGGSVGDGAVEQGDGCDSPSAAGGMVAAACPRCFLYVLISRSDPRCPRCESHVPPPPSPAPKKKPRIDLNVGFLGT